MLDASGQPTPRAHAYTVREVPKAQLARLQEIPLDLMQHGDIAEHLRTGALRDGFVRDTERFHPPQPEWERNFRTCRWLACICMTLRHETASLSTTPVVTGYRRHHGRHRRTRNSTWSMILADSWIIWASPWRLWGCPSMGGNVVVNFAFAHPERVSALISGGYRSGIR
jgi:hypothetical protein